ncbi:carboxypeptidase-like regulatory domain-containing protein [Reichenbachiella sp. MALMAid0571]|uniref:carboxypeptidase-like regulatory domain-containing protein n=1 Tax=Reichenbachiella sp. MALMAid0571 TaxID=3143939 RepID=UPI0032DEE4AB
MKKIKSLTLLLLFTGLISFLNIVLADPVIISGRVTIWNDIPLEKITIYASKSKKETVSNSNGEFSIEVSSKDKLRFSGDGFITQKVSIKGDSQEINVEMELLSDDFSEDGKEQVNDGFRYIPQAHRTNAIERLKERRAQEFASYNSVWDIIRGRIAGVVVQNNNAYFREGLSGSVGTQSTPAIIVLNGSKITSSTVTNLDTRNIKDVSLLKGGAAAVYGGSGGAGVIVITTK